MEMPGDGEGLRATQVSAPQSSEPRRREILIRPAPDAALQVPISFSLASHAAFTCNTPAKELFASLDAQQQGRKPQRGRRQNTELKLLRAQVQRLESHLKQRVMHLRSRIAASGSATSHQRIGRSATKLSAWEGIAVRQIKERLRVEQENRRLKGLQAAYVALAVELRRRLPKVLDLEQAKVLVKSKPKKPQWWDVSSEDDAVIFSEQLAYLVRTFRDLETQHLRPSKAVHFRWDLTLTNGVVKPNPDVEAGIVYETHCGTMVPFALDVAARAYWRAFQYSTTPSVIVTCQEKDTTTNVGSGSFLLQVELEEGRVRGYGKQTGRRHADKDCVTMSWAITSWPVEFCGGKFDGLITQEAAWVKLRGVDSPSVDRREVQPCTSVEMYCELIPVFKEGAPAQEQQIQACLAMMEKVNNALDNEFSQLLGTLLLEEDWKARYGSDCVI